MASILMPRKKSQYRERHQFWCHGWNLAPKWRHQIISKRKLAPKWLHFGATVRADNRKWLRFGAENIIFAKTLIFFRVSVLYPLREDNYFSKGLIFIGLVKKCAVGKFPKSNEESW